MVSVTLPVGLQGTHGSSVTLSASSSTTVSELKALIEEVTGIGASSQGLYFGGSELTSGSQTLSSAGLTSGGAVLLTDKSVGAGGGAAGVSHVVVSVPSALQATYGSSLSISVSSSSTVGELKAALASALGVSTGSVGLSYGGLALSSDSASLGASGVLNGGAIVATLSGPAPSSP